MALKFEDTGVCAKHSSKASLDLTTQERFRTSGSLSDFFRLSSGALLDLFEL